MDLLFAVALGSLCLVQTRKCPVMAFVESPVMVHRHPEGVEAIKGDPTGSNCPLQHGGKGLIKGKPMLFQEQSRLARLFPTGLCEVDVDPSCEAVL